MSLYLWVPVLLWDRFTADIPLISGRWLSRNKTGKFCHNFRNQFEKYGKQMTNTRRQCNLMTMCRPWGKSVSSQDCVLQRTLPSSLSDVTEGTAASARAQTTPPGRVLAPPSAPTPFLSPSRRALPQGKLQQFSQEAANRGLITLHTEAFRGYLILRCCCCCCKKNLLELRDLSSATS